VVLVCSYRLNSKRFHSLSKLFSNQFCSEHFQLLELSHFYRQAQGQNNFNRCSIEMVTRLKRFSKYLAWFGISPANKHLRLRKSLHVSEILRLSVP
jgi:hypothetical protein